MTIRSSIAWTFSEQTLQFALQFAVSVIIARLLTPDEIGIFVLAMSAATVLTSLRTFGIGNYLIREPDLDSLKIRSAFGVMLLVSWSLGLALYLSRHAVAGLYGRPEIAPVLTVLAASFAVFPFGAPAFSLLTREMRFRTLHNIGLAAAAGGSAASVALALLGESAMALAWGLLVTTCLHSGLCLLALPGQVRLRPSLVHWRQIVKFGGTLSLASLVATMNTEGIKVLLGIAMSPTGVAQFSRAAQIPNMVRQGIFAPVARVLTPAWSEDVRNGRPLAEGAGKLVALNTILVWPAFLALALIAEPFITLVFGENWRPAGAIFPWVLLSGAMLTLLPQPEQLLIPHGRAGTILKLRVLGTLFSLAIGAYAATLGLEAFAVSRVAAAGFLMLLVFLAVRPLLAGCGRAFARAYLRAGAVALLAAIPPAAFRFSGRESLNVIELLAMVAACAVLWFVGVVATRHLIWGEMRLIARRAFGH
ncbi:MAG: lipopolysaccharide biosynthesis protein [Kiloniellaceae bacterium]